MSKVRGSVTRAQFARTVLNRLGIHPTDANVQAMIGWERAEGGHWNNTARYNPFNTTLDMPGSGDTGTQGNISIYRNWEQGVQATVKTLSNGLYAPILQALKHGSPTDVAGAIDSSPWGTHGSYIRDVIAEAPGHKGSGSTIGGHYLQGSPGSQGQPSRSGPSRTPGTTSRTVTGGSPPGAAASALLAYAGARGTPSALSDLITNLGSIQAPTVTTSRTPGRVRGRPGKPSGNTGGPQPHVRGLTGTANFEGKTVAAWIKPILKYARAQGWTGSVSSGYRSFAEQTTIYNSGVRPAAVPGTSNHEGSDFPRGAVDVTEPEQLSQILRGSKYAKTLIYAGAKDTVHFSHPHNGGY